VIAITKKEQEKKMKGNKGAFEGKNTSKKGGMCCQKNRARSGAENHPIWKEKNDHDKK